MKKDILKIVFVGHVDHGKSTLIGRLLLDTKSLPDEKMAELKTVAEELGKEAELAHLTDQLKEEREQNITIDTTQIFFHTKTREYVIIDAPGHVEFLKNMITGATQADVAVLLVDMNEGIMEQTIRHAYIVSMFGIESVLVVMNKMDLVDYDEERFKEVKEKLSQSMESMGLVPTCFIPVSARVGENISKKSSKMKWFKGPTFLEALNSFEPSREEGKSALRLPVQDVYEVGDERIAVGRVVSGTVAENQNITFLPSNRHSSVKELKEFGAVRKTAVEGENIGIVIRDDVPISRGEVIVQPENPPKPVDSFKGNLFWMVEEPLKADQPVVLRCATQEVECIAEKIERRIDSSTLEIIEENASTVGINEAAVVVLKTKTPIVAEKFSHVRELGRFVIERRNNVQGAGIITVL
jgi:sulfate adenylyltransferase large subunit